MKSLLIQSRGRLIDLSKPKIMGIVNITPDSFYTSSTSWNTLEPLVDKMIDEGVDILDLGAMSSKPESSFISIDEEKNRLLPILEKVRKKYSNILISVDTTRTEIVNSAAQFEIDFVNDISFGTIDKNIFKATAEHSLAYIGMHMQGNPQTMQMSPNYEDVVLEIGQYFLNKIGQIEKEYPLLSIILDVGIGFGKTIAQNFDLIDNLNYFQFLGKPILIGISRKSFIYKTLNIEPKEALNGTTALHLECLRQGAKILRVHDVKQAIECVKLYQNLKYKKQ